jgi:deoxyribodipyrimidine photo-lyase
LQQLEPRLPQGTPENLSCLQAGQEKFSPASLQLLPDINWYREMASLWQPGEQGAGEKLSTFISGAISDYDIQRDVPGVAGTSWLSPHLHFGELSPNQAWYAALHSSGLSGDDKNLQRFLSELGWREFSYYLLYHFPHLPEQNFNPRFDAFPWRQDEQQLQRWQQGQTGIPIVDAGMRQLWRTGYQHNRVRMIAASFLVKNLLLHWRDGEAWYWDCLLDADLASNSASWQWVAGSGADAAPYFRIFNPVTQGQKFDANGAYVRQYCPELSALPDKYIHNPWEAPAEVLAKANIRLGKDYPEPMADLKATRQRALDAFSCIKNND